MAIENFIHAKALIGGKWRSGSEATSIFNPWDGACVGEMPQSTTKDCDDALESAFAASKVMAKMPGYERAALLRNFSEVTQSMATEIGTVMALETGKAVNDCITEVARSVDTLNLCAEEAVRIEGEHIPMDASAIGAGKIGLSLRFPVGVVAAITPFNAPVNLAAHKIGPALAAGNAIVIKPSPKAPLSFHLFIKAAATAGVPAGAINSLFGDAVGPQLIVDPRTDFISFTGSIPVGKAIREAAGMKRVALELGGIGPTFVHHDADLTSAAKACARNGVLLGGQSCISVQNVYVEQSVFDPFMEIMEQEIRSIRMGNPIDLNTEVGTLIDEQSAKRVEQTVAKAISQGAKLHCGGERSGAAYEGTLLSNVSPTMSVVCEEIFGPVVTATPYQDLNPILESISESPFGLQCGIFTQSIELALSTFRNVRTGGVIVNGTSRWRSDQMPYGGVKDSGIGREGPKYAIRDMTEERVLILNH